MLAFLSNKKPIPPSPPTPVASANTNKCDKCKIRGATVPYQYFVTEDGDTVEVLNGTIKVNGIQVNE